MIFRWNQKIRQNQNQKLIYNNLKNARVQNRIQKRNWDPLVIVKERKKKRKLINNSLKVFK